ncbi:MAG: hypothetical protein LUG54_02055, partial [Clostridiales bacterium]|nr:hypothetical protein [Clostridiales bacterium]
MGNTGRVYLNKGQTVLLSSAADGSMREEFEIRYVIGEGGTAVCYEARRIRDGYSETGKLKEFYPLEMMDGGQEKMPPLRREQDGQLTANEVASERFSVLCREYLETYRMLWRVMENPEHEILRNYIQIGDFFYGTGKFSTVYIWSPGVAGVELDRYFNELRESPEKQAEFKLNNILKIMIALTNCVRAMHIAGILHLDIKPSNFIIPYDSYMRANPDNISLFDINTLYSLNNDFSVKFAGTEGYRAPEVLRGRADNRSDIYSVGAVFFHAIVIADDIEGGLYRDDYYDSIDVLVKNSGLIAASASNSDYHLVQMLADILKHCLAKNPGKRYESCTDLLHDLHAALKLTDQGEADFPSAGVQAGDPGNAIRKLLYEHPLYEAFARHHHGKGEAGKPIPIHVLVVGSGTYGQKFMDLCLQAGQMQGYSLHITAISNTAAEDRENYLQFRPDLRRFVSVNGCMDGDERRAYGTIRFESLPGGASFRNHASTSASSANRELVSAIVLRSLEQEIVYDYIFIALRDDRLNREVARFFARENAARGEDGGCPVCYVSESGEVDPAHSIYPVFIGAPVTPENIDPQLDQMAFNTHISWRRAHNPDIHEEYRKFRASAYHYASSLSFALSLKYKLYSIGVVAADDHDRTGEAAKFYKEILERKDTDAGAKEKFDTLVWLEHRRWVLNLVTEGWTAPLDENGRLCLKKCGDVSHTVKRVHPCLVFSSIGSALDGEDYIRNGRAKWEESEIDPNLDDLDRMSVELHQYFRARAEELRRDNLLQNRDVEAVRMLISRSREKVMQTYRRFEFCLKNILNGVESYSRQYSHYEREFRNALAEVPGDTRRRVEERLESMAKAFSLVVKANLYRDYKKDDEILIERIPFILTFHFRLTMAMTFEDGRNRNSSNEAMFANVASATVLSPEKICYLYYMEKEFYAQGTAPANLLQQRLSSVLNYMRGRGLHTAVTFVAACSEEIDAQERRRLERVLEDMKAAKPAGRENAVLSDWMILPCRDRQDAADKLLSCLAEHPADLYDGSTKLFDSVRESGMFAEKIRESGIPYFEFDRRYKKFINTTGCEYLQYIEDRSCIRVGDMFSLMKAADGHSDLPEFMDDYKTLWDIYTGRYLSFHSFENGVRSWNRLCAALRNYEKGRKPLASVSVFHGQTALERFVYELPAYTFRTARA